MDDNDEAEKTEKTDDEQVVEDTDADTADTEDAEKADEEQVVEDTDADTRDVDSRLDSIEDMLQRVIGTLGKLVDAQAAIVGDGVIYDVDDSTDDEGTEEATAGLLDLSIDDLD